MHGIIYHHHSFFLSIRNLRCTSKLKEPKSFRMSIRCSFCHITFMRHNFVLCWSFPCIKCGVHRKSILHFGWMYKIKHRNVNAFSYIFLIVFPFREQNPFELCTQQEQWQQWIGDTLAKYTTYDCVLLECDTSNSLCCCFSLLFFLFFSPSLHHDDSCINIMLYIRIRKTNYSVEFIWQNNAFHYGSIWARNKKLKVSTSEEP